VIKYLSYKLTPIIPVYGESRKSLFFRRIKSIDLGDSCSTRWIGFENHWGTHVDCPSHFFRKGKTVAEYKADFWVFRKPQIIRIKALPSQIINIKDLKDNIDPKTDLLIIKSGWGKFRGQQKYSCQNPGISPKVGLWLRKKYPKLRVIGFDWISLSSFQNRQLGREAHRAFLDPNGQGHPILIIEDMLLPADIKRLKSVFVAPFRIEAIDSSPCTIIGILR